MATVTFPLTISEITKMRQDGDWISLLFAYASLGFFVMFLVFLSIYYLLSFAAFKPASIVCIPLSAISLLAVYIYRPYFLADKRRRWKDLDKLAGTDLEKGLQKLTEEERDEYLNDLRKKK
jgi:hypothetical protein